MPYGVEAHYSCPPAPPSSLVTLPPAPPSPASRRACVKAPCWEPCSRPPLPGSSVHSLVWLRRASQRGDSLSRVLATPRRGISTFHFIRGPLVRLLMRMLSGPHPACHLAPCPAYPVQAAMVLVRLLRLWAGSWSLACTGENASLSLHGPRIHEGASSMGGMAI